ncbi:MAG: hypothetical protein M3Z11_04285 [Candidatus Dormibacteraeota bacterium]|nr:hypothetical protein [Candidatus Dormibacteraeota bacterium]
MAEPEASSIAGGPTPDPPLEPEDVAEKVAKDTEDKPLPQKAKGVLTELDREVSGEYEAKQEREATP